MVRYYFEQIDVFSFARRLLRGVLNTIVKDHGLAVGEVNIIFCSDDYLLKLNRDFLKHDYYTDILTFGNSEGGIVNGELYISIDRVHDNASTYKVRFSTELYRVVCHGMLHMVGYGDATEDDVILMRSKEEWYIQMMNNQS